MRVDCKHVWGFLSAYIDSTVAPEEQAAIEAHLAVCEICSAILDSVHNILVLTADDRVFRLPVGYSERLHARLDLELSPQSEGPQNTSAPAMPNQLSPPEEE